MSQARSSDTILPNILTYSRKLREEFQNVQVSCTDSLFTAFSKALWNSVDKMQCLSMSSFNLLFDLAFGTRKQPLRIQSNSLVFAYFAWLVTRKRFVRCAICFSLSSTIIDTNWLIDLKGKCLRRGTSQSCSSDTRHQYVRNLDAPKFQELLQH